MKNSNPYTTCTKFGITFENSELSTKIEDLLLLSLVTPIVTFSKVKEIIAAIQSNTINFETSKKLIDTISNSFSSINFNEETIILISKKIKRFESEIGMLEKNDWEAIFKIVPQLMGIFQANAFTNSSAIYNAITTFVKGQDIPIKQMSHYLFQWQKYWEWSKAGMNAIKPVTTRLVIGKTGTGKTFSVKTAANILNAGFISIDASKLSTEGYTGPNITTEIISQYLNIKEENRNRVIVFIDEFDKLASFYHKNDDVKGGNVAMEMLTLFESDTLSGLNSYARSNSEHVTIDISNFCFILGGAFTGINQREEATISGLGQKSVIKKVNKPITLDKITKVLYCL